MEDPVRRGVESRCPRAVADDEDAVRARLACELERETLGIGSCCTADSANPNKAIAVATKIR